jgi:chromosome segregation ATPase
VKQAVTHEQNVEVAQTVLSSNANRHGQHFPDPEGTIPSSLVDVHQSLREVSNRSGPPRVTKNKRKSSQLGPITRNTRTDPKFNPSSYSAAQLYQLADYLKEQERLQEKQDWVQDLAAKQAELEKSNRHRASLQAECAQLEARLQKYSKVSEHLVTMVKAYNGIGHDIKSLQKSRAKYDSDLREFKSQLHTNLDTATNVQEHITKLEKWKVNSLSLIRECKSSVATVAKEKSDLERRLRETSESLVREKQRHDAFDKHLQTYQTERNSTENMLNGCISKISDHLGEFKTFIEQGTSSSEASRELLELMKKENASISEQVHSSVTNMDALKTSVEQLSSG